MGPEHKSLLIFNFIDETIVLHCTCDRLDVDLGWAPTVEAAMEAWQQHLRDLA